MAANSTDKKQKVVKFVSVVGHIGGNTVGFES